MEEYFQAKRRLFTGAQPPPAAVNVGDPWGRQLAGDLEDVHRAPLVTFGLRDDAQVRPEALEVTPSGSRFRAAEMSLQTPLRGVFNVENVLGAVAAALLLDVEEEAIAAGVAAVTGVPGRFEVVDDDGERLALVDDLEAPWNARHGRDARGDRFLFNVEQKCSCNGAEDVLDVEHPAQRRL